MHGYTGIRSHVGKIVELQCFECGSIAISEARITSLECFFIAAHCNVIRAYQRYEGAKIELQKNGHRKILSDIVFFGCTMSFFLSLFVNSPHPS